MDVYVGSRKESSGDRLHRALRNFSPFAPAAVRRLIPPPSGPPRALRHLHRAPGELPHLPQLLPAPPVRRGSIRHWSRGSSPPFSGRALAAVLPRCLPHHHSIARVAWVRLEQAALVLVPPAERTLAGRRHPCSPAWYCLWRAGPSGQVCCQRLIPPLCL